MQSDQLTWYKIWSEGERRKETERLSGDQETCRREFFIPVELLKADK